MVIPDPMTQTHTSTTLADFIVREYWPAVREAYSPEWRTISEYHLKYILEDFPVTPLALVTLRDCEEWWKRVVRNHPAPTANKVLARFKAILRAAQRWGYIQTDLVSGLKRTHQKTRQYVLLEDNERQRLIGRAESHLRHTKYGAYILLALCTGARRKSLATLLKTDVDLFKNEFICRDTKNGEDYRIPIHSKLWEQGGVLEQLLSIPLSHKEWTHSPFLLPQYKDYKTVSSVFYHLRKKLNLDGFRFHDMRHDLGLVLTEQDVPAPVIQKLLGHKTPAMTARYSHCRDQKVRETLEKYLKV